MSGAAAPPSAACCLPGQWGLLMRLVDQAVGRAGQALDHENRKTPISKPAANAQRPSVQAETTRTRLRRSCGISWD
jgi:hypothetical protein